MNYMKKDKNLNLAIDRDRIKRKFKSLKGKNKLYRKLLLNQLRESLRKGRLLQNKGLFDGVKNGK